MIANFDKDAPKEYRLADAQTLAKRPKWHTPRLSQYGITGHTAITNCGSGDDTVICSSS